MVIFRMRSIWMDILHPFFRRRCPEWDSLRNFFCSRQFRRCTKIFRFKLDVQRKRNLPIIAMPAQFFLLL